MAYLETNFLGPGRLVKLKTFFWRPIYNNRDFQPISVSNQTQTPFSFHRCWQYGPLLRSPYLREEIFFHFYGSGSILVLAQLGLDLCSNEFATAKQKFEILKLSVFIKSRIFHPSKIGCLVGETLISF